MRRRYHSLVVGMILAALTAAAGCASGPPHQRGVAVAEPGRPHRFPHRIWAFSGFEARPASFGWFGDAETKNIPAYPGNHTARRGETWKKSSALKTGMNPVPGPRMGTVNKLYVRYFIRGTDQATFQHYSLTCSDNCHIRLSKMTQDKWSEMVLNFTRDSRRNNGSPGAFKKGERMDDLQVYVGKPGQEKELEVIIDDAIFFAEEPDRPPEPEPFPRRVMFLAAFDTGIYENSRAKFFPGEFAPAVGGGEQFGIKTKAPAGAYWVAAKAVPMKAVKSWAHVLLEMKPPRSVGPNTKARFRYWLKGTDRMVVTLADATAGREHDVAVTGCRQGQWITQYVTFSRAGQFLGGGKLDTGSQIRSIRFVVPNRKDVELYVDEVVLFDAYER